MNSQKLIDRIQAREARVGVIGLGYVGLPLVMEFGRAGFHVVGFDIDAHKVDSLARGESYIRHIPAARVRELVETGRLSTTTDFSRIGEVDAALICVPTPLTRQREPDLSYIVRTAEAIAPHLHSGQLIILESTTYPGTTDDVLLGLLEKHGLRAGADFLLAYSPEREDPGNPDFSTGRIPKVVGGVGQEALAAADALYAQIVVKTVPVSSARTAEAVKLTENIFRSVNIALVNELKVIYARMGIDIWEVIEAAKTKPFGYMPFYPGPGLGGHCIPIDPFYLTWKAREYGVQTRFIELAGEVNTSMPDYVIQVLTDALNDHRKSIKGSSILILGLAYKKDVGDPRESPSFRLMELLSHKGAIIDYHDPYVPEIPHMREYPQFAGRHSIEWNRDTLASYDAVLIATDHSDVDYRALGEAARLIVDTRNAMAAIPTPPGRVYKA
jgi:UDP-N-acetyl-D-glucosamine dehydrogenase